MNRTIRIVTGAVALGSLTLAASPVYAVPFASGVRNSSGTTWEFVTNEAADNVTVLRDGANPLNLGALPAGRHTFSMAGFNTFDIRVAKSAPVAWTPISSSANLFTNFERPNDVVVNKDPASPFFGTVYVINGDSAPTASGRAMGDGVYALTSDLIGVDLPTRAALSDPNDVSAAKAPDWTVNLSNASPWRMALDAAGNLIVSDWSDDHGGIKYASADLATGGLILEHEDGIRPLLDPNTVQVHGSIVSRPYVTGSVGNNLVVYAMDEDNDFDGVTDGTTETTGNHVWKWNVGNATNYNQAPQLVINTANIPTTDDFRSNFLSLNVGVIANATFSAAHNKWYLTESRNNGGEAGFIVVTADGVDGMTPTVDWSSLQFSVDNALDGNNDEDLFPGIQDVFLQMGGGMELSPDGTKLYLHKLGNPATNPVLGSTSNLPGAVLVIPLDANGIPQLQVAGGQITNMESISTTQGNDAGATRRGLSRDAAGNVYTTNNASELLEVFSPGGNWLASTTSAGGFTLSPLTPSEDADFNNDGHIDGADFLIWQRGLGAPGTNATGDANGDGNVNGVDLGIWKNLFATAAVAAGGAVPEPAAGVLAAMVVAALGCAGRRPSRRSPTVHVGQ
jgi:hypothetical protein